MAAVEIIAQLLPDAARRLAQSPNDAQTHPIAALSRHYGAAVVPLDPGGDDPSLGRSFAIQLNDEARAEELARQLRAHPDVEGAYIKPAGEAPGR
jgi:hypothetical protein